MDKPLPSNTQETRSGILIKCLNLCNIANQTIRSAGDLSKPNKFLLNLVTQILKKKKTKEKKDQSSSDGMESSSSSCEQEFDSDYKQTNYDSLVNMIKELRNDFNIYMKKLLHLWILLQNQIPKLEAPIIENNALILANNPEINQRDVVIHIVEDFQKIREKYSFEIFFRNELVHFDSKLKKKHSEILKHSENIEPLAYFLFRNQSLTL